MLRHPRLLLTCAACLGILVPVMAQSGSGQTNRTNRRTRTASSNSVEGLTEPFRRVELAAAETGLITEINVREGQNVTKGEVLAKLDDLRARGVLSEDEFAAEKRRLLDS